MATVPCTELTDSYFGPIAKCSQLDFTLTFEQSILGIGISSLFLLWLPFKFVNLYKAPIRTSTNSIHKAKIVWYTFRERFLLTEQVISILILALQLAILVLWSLTPITTVAIAAAVLELSSVVAISMLGVTEYQRTIRPSRTTTTYLLGAILADCVIIRTLYIRDYVSNIAYITTAAVACKVVYLLLESWPKTGYLKLMSHPPGRVDVAGPFSRAFMMWLNPMLIRGYSNILSLTDVYPLDHDLYSEALRDKMEQCWEKCEKASRNLE